MFYPILSYYYYRYTSAKYTLLTFLPFNLLEQFRRLANAYFLLILIVCYILYVKGATPVNPSAWILSVVFIFGVTMIKQGYEDFQRHRNDRYNKHIYIFYTSIQRIFSSAFYDYLNNLNNLFCFRKTNKRPVRLLKNMAEIDSTAEQICVGDIIVLTEDDIVPCDAVILSTSNDAHQVI